MVFGIFWNSLEFKPYALVGHFLRSFGILLNFLEFKPFDLLGHILIIWNFLEYRDFCLDNY